MEPATRRWLRLAAATSATALAAIATMWLLPAVAWARDGPAVALVGDEVARRPRRGIGAPGACCCLLVVLVIVLIVMLVRRRRQAPPPPPPPPPPASPPPQ